MSAAKCIVAKWLSGSRCRLGWSVGSVKDGCIRWVVIVEGEGAVLGVNLGCPIVTEGDFAMQLFPNYFGQDLFLLLLFQTVVKIIFLSKLLHYYNHFTALWTLY